MKLNASFILLPAMVFGLAACDVQQTEEGEMPEVDVETRGGNMPEYDVQTGDVDVGTEKKEVTVPTMDYESPDEQAAEEKAGME